MADAAHTGQSKAEYLAEFLARPDPHLDPVVAAAYDDPDGTRFAAAEVEPTVALLVDIARTAAAEGAGDGSAVEFAVGTGRIALPLAAALAGDGGIRVYGLDLSAAMLDQLRRKPGADRIAVTEGDMTTTVVHTNASLVYLVYNSIINLRTQDLQVACFRNAAAHLAPGGRFLLEVEVPQLRRLLPGETVQPFDLSPRHLGFDEYVDLAEQILISHHYHLDPDDPVNANGRQPVRVGGGAFRYVWPSELDLMAQLAGMKRESRWADWHRTPFDGTSQRHVSVWRKLPTAQ